MKIFAILFFALFALRANASELIEIKVEGMNDEKTEELVRNTFQILPVGDIAQADRGTSRVVVSLKEGEDIPTDMLTDALVQMKLKVVSVSRTGNN